MSFKKDGEVKVFVKKDGAKTASQEERYTVDDLVEDSDKKTEEDTGDKKDVSN